MTDDPSAHDQFPYPGGSIVAVLLDEAALTAARANLTAAGFAADGYDVLEGERDVGRIDVEGGAHGFKGTIKRALQTVFSDDADHARLYADHLREGHYVVGVPVGEDDAAKQGAADALRRAGAETINYYGKNIVEDLSGA